MNIGENSQLTERATLRSAATVLAVNDLNLSILGPLWLTREGILLEEELGAQSIVTPALAVFPSAMFELALMPQRIQMRFRPQGYQDAQKNVLRVVGGIVRALPHTPYAGIGLNFQYLLSPPNGESFPDWNRGLFGGGKAAQLAGAAEPDTLFGSYMSCTIDGMRLKLNMAPVTRSTGGSETEAESQNASISKQFMNVGFNYHTKVQGKPIEDIVATLERLDQAFEHSRGIVTSLEQ